MTIKATVPQDGNGGAFRTRMLVSTKPKGKGDVLGRFPEVWDDLGGSDGYAGTPMIVKYTLAMP